MFTDFSVWDGSEDLQRGEPLKIGRGLRVEQESPSAFKSKITNAQDQLHLRV